MSWHSYNIYSNSKLISSDLAVKLSDIQGNWYGVEEPWKWSWPIKGHYWKWFSHLHYLFISTVHLGSMLEWRFVWVISDVFTIKFCANIFFGSYSPSLSVHGSESMNNPQRQQKLKVKRNIFKVLMDENRKDFKMHLMRTGLSWPILRYCITFL